MINAQELNNDISKKLSFFMLGFILIVVLFHSDFRYYYPFIEDLTAVSTSYFFCVSAFFFYKGLNKKNFIIRLRKRCITLLLPYLLWNLLYMIFYCQFYDLSLINIVKGFTVNPLCTPSWYLLTLFIFFVPASIMKRFMQKKYTAFLLLILGIVISYSGYIRFQHSLATIPIVGGYLIRMAEYLTPYLIGGIIGTWFSTKLNVTWKNCIIGTICSFSIFTLLLCDISLEIRWFLWVLLPLSLWETVPEKIFCHINFLHLFTEPAFLINMMHCYFMFLWGLFAQKFELVTGKYLSVLNVALTLISSYLLFYLLKLLVPRLLNILTGNRIREKNKPVSFPDRL